MNEHKHILIIEDDEAVADIVAASLEDTEFVTQHANTGQAALNIVSDQPIDLCIVDLGLPDMDGLSLTRELKSRKNIGLIILSGRSETTERIIGLEVGADDYIAKPFEPRELLARVRSVVRRLAPTDKAPPAPVAPQKIDTPPAYQFEGWEVIPQSLAVKSPEGKDPNLSSTEFSLLQAFIDHPNRVLSRDQLLDLVHGDATPAFDRSIDVQITRLRKKIEPDPKTPQFIKTIRNRGYIFTPKVTRT